MSLSNLPGQLSLSLSLLILSKGRLFPWKIKNLSEKETSSQGNFFFKKNSSTKMVSLSLFVFLVSNSENFGGRQKISKRNNLYFSLFWC